MVIVSFVEKPPKTNKCPEENERFNHINGNCAQEGMVCKYSKKVCCGESYFGQLLTCVDGAWTFMYQDTRCDINRDAPCPGKQKQ